MINEISDVREIIEFGENGLLYQGSVFLFATMNVECQPDNGTYVKFLHGAIFVSSKTRSQVRMYSLLHQL